MASLRRIGRRLGESIPLLGRFGLKHLPDIAGGDRSVDPGPPSRNWRSPPKRLTRTQRLATSTIPTSCSGRFEKPTKPWIGRSIGLTAGRASHPSASGWSIFSRSTLDEKMRGPLTRGNATKTETTTMRARWKLRMTSEPSRGSRHPARQYRPHHRGGDRRVGAAWPAGAPVQRQGALSGCLI